MNYYNENNPEAAAWLASLMLDGLIPLGEIDTRSIVDVSPDELFDFRQCHFFAGIGGWALAFKMAGIREDARIWTASCPCQPFSIVGNRKTNLDERHLWPVFGNLARKCNPSTIFGEQVASPDGRDWLAGVQFDLEEMGYAFGGSDLCAAGLGAPHVRQRLYWMAHAHRIGRQSRIDWLPLPEGASREVRGAIPGGRSGNPGVWDSFSERTSRGAKRYRMDAQPGSYPLAHGFPGGVGLLRGYGNAIVPPLAAAFVEAGLESIEELSSSI